MHRILRNFAPILLATTLASTTLMVGCAVHARYYDPYYHDYHPVDGEVVFYSQWEHDTHREHMDLNKRSEAEKKEYWDWRHNHQ
jgi:hypothetical protein